jgi:FkbM family methyltransferase
MAVGETGQVVGVEPNPVSYAKCRLHVQQNSLEWVRIFNAAASDSEGTVALFLSGGRESSSAHMAYEDERPDAHLSRVEVRTIALDALVESGEIRPPDFVKVDVEGHGARALAGARKAIADRRPTLVMSFHSTWELEGTRRLLEPLGYRAFASAGEHLRWEDTLYRTAVLRV